MKYDEAWNTAQKIVDRAFDLVSMNSEAILDFNLTGEAILIQAIAEALRQCSRSPGDGN